MKSHPLYIDLEKTHIPKTEHEELKQEYGDFKLNQGRIATLGVIQKDALTILRSMNPVESENAKIAENRRADWLKKFDPYDYDIAEDRNHTVKKDGARIEDSHANAIKFEDFVKLRAAEYYDFAQSSARGQAGNVDKGNGQGAHVDVPTDEKDYLTKMNDLMLKGDRDGAKALKEAWESKNQK